MCERIWGDKMTKRIFNRFDPFLPVKLDSKASDFSVSETSNDIFEDFSSITLNEGLKIRTPQINKGFVVMITKKSIGSENGLGEKLLEDFVYSLSNSLDLPQYLIFMNEAVFLLDKENVLNSLNKLKKYGVKNLVSIESLDYFKHKINSRYIIQATSGDITDKMLLSKKLITL